jgi:GNAT superfamily N-acetyltransferase
VGCQFVCLHLLSMDFELDSKSLNHETQDGEVTYRSVTAAEFDDWDRLWTLYLSFYATTLPDALHKLTFERYTTRKDMKSFFAVSDGRVIGLANVIFHPSGWLTNCTCYLQDLFVDLSFRKRGAGKGLIEHVRKCVTKAGVQKLYWMVKEQKKRVL